MFTQFNFYIFAFPLYHIIRYSLVGNKIYAKIENIFCFNPVNSNIQTKMLANGRKERFYDFVSNHVHAEHIIVFLLVLNILLGAWNYNFKNLHTCAK